MTMGMGMGDWSFGRDHVTLHIHQLVNEVECDLDRAVGHYTASSVDVPLGSSTAVCYFGI